MSQEHAASASVRWFHELKVDGAVAFRVGRRGAQMVACWPGLGTLTCAPDGTAAKFASMPGVPRRVLSKLERGQVRALLRDLAGHITVHASAAAWNGLGILFLGSDGAGKSTAAAEMCVRHGAQMLADDAASIDVGAAGVSILPSEEDHWLTAESRVALGIPRGRPSKRQRPASSVAGAPAPLALVVALRFDPAASAPVFRPLRGVDAARMLLEAVIRFDLEDGAARRRELSQLTAIHAAAPFMELVRPARSPGGVAPFVLDAIGSARR